MVYRRGITDLRHLREEVHFPPGKVVSQSETYGASIEQHTCFSSCSYCTISAASTSTWMGSRAGAAVNSRVGLLKNDRFIE